jgi:hypothetical protein
MANDLELFDSRGVYKHPTHEAVAAAGLDDLRMKLFAEIERTHVALADSLQRIADLKDAISAKEAEITAAQKHLAEIRPAVTFHQLWKASFK